MSVWKPFSSESVRRWPTMRQCSCSYGRVILKPCVLAAPDVGWIPSVYSSLVIMSFVGCMLCFIYISLGLVRSCFPLFCPAVAVYLIFLVASVFFVANGVVWRLASYFKIGPRVQAVGLTWSNHVVVFAMFLYLCLVVTTTQSSSL